MLRIVKMVKYTQKSSNIPRSSPTEKPYKVGLRWNEWETLRNHHTPAFLGWLFLPFFQVTFHIAGSNPASERSISPFRFQSNTELRKKKNGDQTAPQTSTVIYLNANVLYVHKYFIHMYFFKSIFLNPADTVFIKIFDIILDYTTVVAIIAINTSSSFTMQLLWPTRQGHQDRGPGHGQRSSGAAAKGDWAQALQTFKEKMGSAPQEMIHEPDWTGSSLTFKPWNNFWINFWHLFGLFWTVDFPRKS